MKIPTSTVRLAAVVKHCGRPEPVTLWANPKRDKAFQAALAENRILTVKQETAGTRKDFGVVGFHREKNVSYWVFSKPLDRFEGKRVIGIDYDLLDLPDIKSPEGARPPARPARQERAAKPVSGPTRRTPRFRVIVRYVSTVDMTREVEAPTMREAKEKALERIAGEKVEFARGVQSRRVVRVQKLPANAPSPAALFRRLRGLPDSPGRGGERPGRN